MKTSTHFSLTPVLGWLLCIIGLIGCAPAVTPTPLTTPLSPPSATTPSVNPNNAPIKARLNEPFTLKLKQHAILQDSPDGWGVGFFAPLNDSRCPRSVACVTKGEARLHLVFYRGGIILPPLLEISTEAVANRNQVTFNGYTVQLKELRPYPEQAGQSIKPGDYEAIFVITQ